MTVTSRDRRYIYPVRDIEKFTDGDTYWFRMDYGFRQTWFGEIRLLGYDTPERHKGSAFERSEAVRATGVATAWLTQALHAGNLWVRTEPDPDDFGRYLGEIWAEPEDGVIVRLGEVLRAQRLASVWPTRWHEEFDTGPHAVAKPVYPEEVGESDPDGTGEHHDQPRP